MALKPVTLMEAIYEGVQVFVEKLGEFLREIAALILVFIPLDLWKNEITWMRSFGVVAASTFLFVAGVGCEFAGIAVKRVRERYEEEKANEPS